MVLVKCLDECRVNVLLRSVSSGALIEADHYYYLADEETRVQEMMSLPQGHMLCVPDSCIQCPLNLTILSLHHAAP